MARRVLTALALLWAGMLLGISFLEAPVKFQAPSLTLPVALDVGRTVFGVFEKVQLALCAAIALALVWGPASRPTTALVATVVALTLAQALWLRPALDARVTLVLRGAALPASPHHAAFIALEAAKVALLLALGWRGLARAEFSPRRG